MGQHEVLNILKNKRLSGDDNYFAVAQIRKLCLDREDEVGSLETISKVVSRLNRWGLLDHRTFDGVSRYRVKKKVFEDSAF